MWRLHIHTRAYANLHSNVPIYIALAKMAADWDLNIGWYEVDGPLKDVLNTKQSRLQEKKKE